VTIHDEENVGLILMARQMHHWSNPSADHFTADLFRLIARADTTNRGRLFTAYPDEVQCVHKYLTGKPFEPPSNQEKREP
tara:strand:+ start:165 stop:404 length:240 start_codon:yes stop_codon:yes gene_type:complete